MPERVEVLGKREVLDLREQSGQRRCVGQRVMVPRRRGLGRQVEDVAPIAAADRRAVVVVDVRVQKRREQHDAVEADTLGLADPSRARQERVVPYDSPKRKRGEFQRLKPRDVPLDELTRRRRRLRRRPKDRSRVPAPMMRPKAAAGHVDEDQVGPVEQRVLIVDDPVGRRPR